jgi:hypothetical protein
MGSEPICERLDVDAWNERFRIGMIVERDVDMVCEVYKANF